MLSDKELKHEIDEAMRKALLDNSPVLKEGDVLEFTIDVRGGSGKIFTAGERMKLVAKTQHNPFNQYDKLHGHNWIVSHDRLEGDERVWASLYWGLLIGWLKIVEFGPEENEEASL